MDHSGHFIVWIIRGKRGRREGKDLIFTCQTIEIKPKNGMSKVSVFSLRGCLNVFLGGDTLENDLSSSNPTLIKLFFGHLGTTQWPKSTKNEIYESNMGIWAQQRPISVVFLPKTISIYRPFLFTVFRLASYHLEQTSSRAITEVKLGRAGLVLLWVSAVGNTLCAQHFFEPICPYRTHRFHFWHFETTR